VKRRLQPRHQVRHRALVEVREAAVDDEDGEEQEQPAAIGTA
jgi:hypothetical protein